MADFENLSYATLQQALDYHVKRGNFAWTENGEEQQQAALIKASEWIDGFYEFVGFKKEKDQLLQWPRTGAVDHDNFLREGIPTELIHATAWLASYATNGEIDEPAQRGGQIQRVQAGSVQIEWNKSAPAGTVFRHVNRMLKKITTGGQNTVKLVRT